MPEIAVFKYLSLLKAETSSISAPDKSIVAGAMESPFHFVLIIESFIEACPKITSYIDWLKVPGSIPTAEVAFACGSKSTIKTLFPVSARHVAIFTTVVVFPTPPFWLATVMTLGNLFREEECLLLLNRSSIFSISPVQNILNLMFSLVLAPEETVSTFHAI